MFNVIAVESGKIDGNSTFRNNRVTDLTTRKLTMFEICLTVSLSRHLKSAAECPPLVHSYSSLKPLVGISIHSFGYRKMSIVEMPTSMMKSSEQFIAVLFPILVMIAGIGLSYGIFTALRWVTYLRRRITTQAVQVDTEAGNTQGIGQSQQAIDVCEVKTMQQGTPQGSTTVNSDIIHGPARNKTTSDSMQPVHLTCLGNEAILARKALNDSNTRVSLNHGKVSRNTAGLQVPPRSLTKGKENNAALLPIASSTLKNGYKPLVLGTISIVTPRVPERAANARFGYGYFGECHKVSQKIHAHFSPYTMTPHGSAEPSSSWRSIRPWAPPLSLTPREITSVSATFILSTSTPTLTHDVASIIAATEHPEKSDTDIDRDDDKISKNHKSFIADMLAKGLFSVNINGSPWHRHYIRVADTSDQAVIIIHGLMPGRQYDIDLGLVQNGQSNNLQTQLTTEDHEHSEAKHAIADIDPLLPDDAPSSPTSDHPSSASSHSSTSSISSASAFASGSVTSASGKNVTSASNSSSASSVAQAPDDVVVSVEEHMAQLQETLDHLNVERDTLTANLKASRKEAQKGDAALRTEIEILKRASEKHTIAEQRSKQKILALQEAHKRAVASTQEMEKQVEEIEALLPDLTTQKEAKEKEVEMAEAEADKLKKEQERRQEEEKKITEGLKSELAGLDHKLEKLGTKREKLEKTTIPGLEEQLRLLAEEIEKMEAEERELEHALATTSNESQYKINHVDEMGILRRPTHNHSQFLAPQSQPQQERIRHHSFHGAPPYGIIGRQSAPLGQRMTETPINPNAQPYTPPPHLWNTVPARQSQIQRQHTNLRTQTYPQTNTIPHHRTQMQQTPIILTNPQRRPSLLKSNTTTAAGSSGSVPQQPQNSPALSFSSNSSYGSTPPLTSTPSSTASPPSVPAATNTNAAPSISITSTLSGRAPAFEPKRGLGLNFLPKGSGNQGFQHRSNLGPSAAPGTPIGFSTGLRVAGANPGSKP
ncbi:hypothetical protein AMATHDRAFT_47834 [Amanita thiersii Skay4041]|uniref:Uncharacterized protein n=1 Tax=Amanita thiersii Skay4041 TaxID=703135 RepID=A0A2A9NQB7_9AGAR|nr:hypothetical protein AMATHDRAFT_47834 [Amanita thiersii Skay4041]